MIDNKIELKTINELLGLRFFIPSYQRGYRWTEQQVKDLLNDVNEFVPEKVKDSDDSTWYCLQPLVVARMDEQRKKDCQLNTAEDWCEVIDGQQRLTTIFIILKLLGDGIMNQFYLKYQTRLESESFLENIKDKSNASNIDFYFMLGAKKTIEHWDGNRTGLVEKIQKSCRVIWYETKDNAYDVFKRLNSGKISLSNAELVKALLLKDYNFIGLDDDALKLKQLEMAGEWDRMEQTLHDDSFWYFINPEPEATRFNCTRIDFLLEMILRCENEDLDNKLKQNDYYIFSTYSNRINNEGWEKQWHDIQKYYRIMKAWYDDRRLYHYVGYLMNLKGENKMSKLRELLCDAEKPKDEFLLSLINRCQRTIGISEKQNVSRFDNWEYNKNNNEIHNVLLLFNLATTQNQISEMSRYPFDKHYKAAQKKWSLEHIHAQNEKKANWNADQFNKIKNYLKSINIDGIKELNDFLENKYTSEDIDDETYKAIISAFMGRKVEIRYIDGVLTFSSNFEKDDHLTNMALLQGDKNAAFNNKLYPEKRAKLAEYENVENESLFVPICTRNVFFKHYSPNSTNPLLWDEQAGIEYITAIIRVIASYLFLEAIEPNKENIYGVKKRGE